MNIKRVKIYGNPFLVRIRTMENKSCGWGYVLYLAHLFYLLTASFLPLPPIYCMYLVYYFVLQHYL